jgi:TetR/AcrR family transcriptional repressor of nem operon
MPRPRAFDESRLIDAAVELFWAKGYTRASLGDLTAQTGVTNGSLYQAFGTKWGLFLTAYRVYCDRRAAVVAEALGQQRSGIDETLSAYFDAIVDDCAAHPDRRGCLMLNTISEFGTNDDVAAISTQTMAAMEHSVSRALRRVAPPAVGDAEIDLFASQTVALSQALIQLSRVGRHPADLRRMGRSAAAATQIALLAA